MPKSTQTTISILKTLLDEYQLTPYSLAKAISLSYSAARQITIGKSKISVSTALRLAKLFGQTPDYWLDLQRAMDLNEAANDTELQSVLQGISKAKKPSAKASTEVKNNASRKIASSDKPKNAARTSNPGSGRKKRS
jgi:addiction module HigA family antidote